MKKMMKMQRREEWMRREMGVIHAPAVVVGSLYHPLSHHYHHCQQQHHRHNPPQ
jgi:hypothetical protein